MSGFHDELDHQEEIRDAERRVIEEAMASCQPRAGEGSAWSWSPLMLACHTLRSLRAAAMMNPEDAGGVEGHAGSGSSVGRADFPTTPGIDSRKQGGHGSPVRLRPGTAPVDEQGSVGPDASEPVLKPGPASSASRSTSPPRDWVTYTHVAIDRMRCNGCGAEFYTYETHRCAPPLTEQRVRELVREALTQRPFIVDDIVRPIAREETVGYWTNRSLRPLEERLTALERGAGKTEPGPITPAMRGNPRHTPLASEAELNLERANAELEAKVAGLTKALSYERDEKTRASVAWSRIQDDLVNQIEALKLASAPSAMPTHRCVGDTEHDPSVSAYHGCCRICAVPWPCDAQKQADALFAGRAPTAATQEEREALQSGSKVVGESRSGDAVQMPKHAAASSDLSARPGPKAAVTANMRDLVEACRCHGNAAFIRGHVETELAQLDAGTHEIVSREDLKRLRADSAAWCDESNFEKERNEEFDRLRAALAACEKKLQDESVKADGLYEQVNAVNRAREHAASQANRFQAELAQLRAQNAKDVRRITGQEWFEAVNAVLGSKVAWENFSLRREYEIAAARLSAPAESEAGRE